MMDSETLEKLQNASIEERITIIEMLLRSLKNDMPIEASPQSEATAHLQGDVGVAGTGSDIWAARPAFGFMKGTGTILGDVVAPVLPENAWEVFNETPT